MMYLDRNDIAFREEEKKGFLKKERITVFRPGNRIYPQERWYIPWEVVKARIIDTPWNDEENRPPIFSDTVAMVKIETINVLKQDNLKKIDFLNSLEQTDSKEKLRKNFEKIYKNKDFNIITKIDMKKIDTNELIDNSDEIRELFSSWIIQFAMLPEGNITNIEEILQAWNFSFTFINHDYAGMTPKMRNHIASLYNVDIKNSMVIIQPENFEKVLDILQKNNKFIGGWLGVWFKDLWRKVLKQKEYWFIDPVADEMQSINFIAHFWPEIHGYNSDASWYVESLCDKFNEIWMEIQNKNIIILWAGWTARGIALELANRWVNSVNILNRTVEKAEHISERLNKTREGIATAGDENKIFTFKDRKIDAIINLSTKWADGDLALYSWLTPTEWWVEKNLYNTKELLREFKINNPEIIISDINLTKTGSTPLLDGAREAWLYTLDGVSMWGRQWGIAIWTVWGYKVIEQWWTKEQINEHILKLISKKPQQWK